MTEWKHRPASAPLQPNKKEREERDEAMRQDWKQGLNVTTIARRHGLSPNWCGVLLAQLGINVRERAGNRGHLLALDEDKVARLYNEGATIRAIAAELGVSYGTVRRILERRDDVTFRPRGTQGVRA